MNHTPADIARETLGILLTWVGWALVLAVIGKLAIEIWDRIRDHRRRRP